MPPPLTLCVVIICLSLSAIVTPHAVPLPCPKHMHLYTYLGAALERACKLSHILVFTGLCCPLVPCAIMFNNRSSAPTASLLTPLRALVSDISEWSRDAEAVAGPLGEVQRRVIYTALQALQALNGQKNQQQGTSNGGTARSLLTTELELYTRKLEVCLECLRRTSI